MPSFRTYFSLKNARTDVVVTPLEDHCFGIELESTDVFDEDRDPKKQTISSMKPPLLIVQKTKTKGWVILQSGSMELTNQDLQALGRAIENSSKQAL